MTDTVKLIIEISKEDLKRISDGEWIGTHAYDNMILNGTPLDDVKAEIIDKAIKGENGEGFIFLGRLLKIFDSIGKAEREDEEC